MIVFHKENHRYESSKGEYTSVSKLIGKFKNDFNKEHWAAYKALERLIPNFKEVKQNWIIESPEFIEYASSLVNPSDLSATIAQILEEWQQKNTKSIMKGNFYHKTKEELAYATGHELNPFTQKLVPVVPQQQPEDRKTAIVTNLALLTDGFYPELLIWNDPAMIAGQSDKVYIETINGVRFVDIDDIKTNIKISKFGYKNAKMKHPVAHLPDANYYHYNLQLSLYAWMLEQAGFSIRNLAFHHFNKMYQLDYLKKEVEAIVNS